MIVNATKDMGSISKGDTIVICDVCLSGSFDQRSIHFCECDDPKMLCPSCYCEDCDNE